MSKLTIQIAFKIFNLGVDYGQLKAEEERDNEDLLNAFNGVLEDKKFSMPAMQIKRRMPHSKKWREVKQQSLINFEKMIAELAKMDGE